ncbi:hypothetical protein EMPG_12130 [Blastomyces silverae]|uniref:Uncharacterized protein n=1 Tax=Blastomyces silverae TaxID=2060906 RepID=A0A0H1BN08_9EURO|nr:hypothetical protein EMPG_12130 [Blastomyces silverae]
MAGGYNGGSRAVKSTLPQVFITWVPLLRAVVDIRGHPKNRPSFFPFYLLQLGVLGANSHHRHCNRPNCTTESVITVLWSIAGAYIQSLRRIASPPPLTLG